MSPMGLGPAIVLAGLLLAGCGAQSQPAASMNIDRATTVSFAQRLAQADADVQAASLALEAAPEVADNAVALTEALLERAWLSGQYTDFVDAEQALQRGRDALGQSPSFCLVEARLQVTLHRLGLAAAALERCGPFADPQMRERLEADLQFMRGDLLGALTSVRRRLNSHPSVSSWVQMAMLQEAAGAPEEAKALFRSAEDADHSGDPAQRAWLRLRRGHVALHQGRWEEARAVYLSADSALPGWWLIEEHLAEIEALMGESAAAEARYRSIIERTDLPEFMDSLAGLLADQGRDDEARTWIDRARDRYDERLNRFPEAAAGHALDHFLQFDPSRALALAVANYAERPYAEPALGLARALVLSGQWPKALDLLKRHSAEGWASAEWRWVLGELLIMAADAQGEGHQQAALSLNPRAADMYGLSLP